MPETIANRIPLSVPVVQSRLDKAAATKDNLAFRQALVDVLSNSGYLANAEKHPNLRPVLSEWVKVGQLA